MPRVQGQSVLELLARLEPAAARILGQVSRHQREQAETHHGRLRLVGGGAEMAVPELRSQQAVSFLREGETSSVDKQQHLPICLGGV